MRLRRQALTVLLTSAVLVLVGVGLPTTAAAAPVVGACYEYPADTLTKVSSGAPAIGCESPHTAETFWVGTVADAIGLPSKVTPVSYLTAGKPCTAKVMNTYLGFTDRSLPSRFTTVVLLPTDAQWAAGERWVRCDVVLKAGKALKSITGTATGLVAATPEAIFNFCTPKEPRAASTAAYPCTNAKKNWIKVLDVTLGGPAAKFPGDQAVAKYMQAQCKKMAKKYDGKIPYPGYWGLWPTSRGWTEGTRMGQCFVPYNQYLKELAQNAPRPTPSPSPTPVPSPAPTVTPVAPEASPAPSPSA